MKNYKTILFPLFLSLFSLTFTSCDLMPRMRSSKAPSSQEKSHDDSSEAPSSKVNSTSSNNTQHQHTYANYWSYDDEYHWKDSTCEHQGLKSELERHTFVYDSDIPATYESGGYQLYVCTVCGAERRISTPALEHHYSDVYSYDDNYHWQQCEDYGYENLYRNRGRHDLFEIENVPATYDAEGRIVYGCTVCSYTDVTVFPPSGHNYSPEWSYDETIHYHACTDEGYTNLKSNIEAHTLVCVEQLAATYERSGYNVYRCSVCGYTYSEDTPQLEHRFNSAWSFDESAHWHACRDAGYEQLRADYAEHTYEEYSRTEATFENPSSVIYRCSVCSQQKRVVNDDQLVHSFSDEWMSDEQAHWHYCLDEGYFSLKDSYEEHDYVLSYTLDSTFETEGYDQYTCSICGHVKEVVKPVLEHSYSSGWTSDLSGHWHQCIDTGYENLKSGFVEHNLVDTYYGQKYNEVKCSECGLEMIVDHEGCRVYPNPDSDDNGLLYYLMANNEYCVAGDDRVIGDSVSIPASHNGLPVTRIMASGFEGSPVRSVAISSGISQIGHAAFCNCHQLVSIVVPDSVTYIGSYAFASSGIESIAIPALVTSLEPGVFSHCYGLTSMYIHEGITEISTESFMGCPNIQEITVNSNNQYFSSENGVLYNKDKTELIFCPLSISGEFVLPDNLSTVNEQTFEQCFEITGFAVSENNQYFSSENGVLYNKNKTKLIAVPKSKTGEVIIPDTVREVVSSAFVNCLNITAVTIPYGMEEVCDRAFMGCSSLASVTIPETVRRIGSCAFSGCISLTSIEIPNGVTRLDSNVFDGAAITDVYLPATINSIDSLAFQGSASIQSITVDPNSDYFVSYNNALFNKNMTKLIYCPGAWSGDFVLPEGVVECARYAFYATRSVSSISFPSTFTQDITNIEFVNCSGLTSVVVDENNQLYSSVDGVLFDKNQEVLYLCPRGREGSAYVVPEGVITIKTGSLSFLNNIRLITLPRSLRTIEKDSFYATSNLTDIIILSCEVTFERDAVRFCNAISNVYLTTTIGDSGYVTKVKNAFSNVNVYFYLSEEPQEHGVFWHYVEGSPVVW